MDFPEDTFVQLSKANLHLVDQGEGAPVVLLHDSGGGNNGRFHWMKNIDALSESFRVLALDVPGWGLTEGIHVDEPRHIFLANIVNELLDTLSLEKAHIIGAAHGGAAAIKFAAMYPSKTDRLVIVSTSGAGAPLFTPMPTPAVMLAFGTHFEPNRQNIQDFMRVTVLNQSLITDEMVDYRLAEAERVLPYHVEELKNPNLVANFQIVEDLPSLGCETLILMGREDQMNTLDTALLVARNIRNAELNILPNCGHWVPFEKPELFNAKVTKFFQRT